jgi:hypothetical protein
METSLKANRVQVRKITRFNAKTKYANGNK